MDLTRLSRASLRRVLQDAGLTLSESQVQGIADTENACLSDTGRVSFGESAASRIVCEFAMSPYIYDDCAFEAFVELTEAFYELREEYPASVTDIEIIELLKASYDGEAAGDVDLAITLARESLLSSCNDAVFEITDCEGKMYRLDPEEWHDDVMVDGWYGERWDDDDD